MKEENEILLEVMRQEFEMARNMENQRATITNFFITIAGASQALIVQRGFDNKSTFVGIGLIVLGFYGAVITAKLHERSEYYSARVGKIRERLDYLNPKADIKEALQSVRTDRKTDSKSNSLIYRTRLNIFWRAIHIGIASVGTLDVVWILFLKRFF